MKDWLRCQIRSLWFAWKRRRCVHPDWNDMEVLKEHPVQNHLGWKTTPDGTIIPINLETQEVVMRCGCTVCGHVWIETRRYGKEV